jgi:hypothetical protein
MQQELGALNFKSEKAFGVRSFYSDPNVMSEHGAGCQSVWMRNARSLACHWQTHLPDAMADNTYLLNQAHVQYQSGTGGSTVEKPAETLRLVLAS